MSIQHHPSAETLAAFTAGSLDLGRRLVVASHLERCAACRRTAGDLEEVGGALLETAAVADMAPGAWASMLARLDAPPASAPVTAKPAAHAESGLPACLRPYALGAWRWVGPGVEMRPILLPDRQPVSVFLLKAKPGTRMPEHSHRGDEFTSILSGAFAHAGGYFGPGDFEQADDTVEHRPVVTPDGECICLVALEGRLKLSGVVGTLLNPFLRL